MSGKTRPFVVSKMRLGALLLVLSLFICFIVHGAIVGEAETARSRGLEITPATATAHATPVPTPTADGAIDHRPDPQFEFTPEPATDEPTPATTEPNPTPPNPTQPLPTETSPTPPRPAACATQTRYTLQQDALVSPFLEAAAAWARYLGCEPFVLAGVNDALQAGPQANGYAEVTWRHDACLNGGGNGGCQFSAESDITLSLDLTYYNPYTNWKSMLMHELGHTLGFMHDEDPNAPNVMRYGCWMGSDGYPSTDDHGFWDNPDDPCS